MRRAGEVSRTMRPPHEVAQELGHLLGQLLSSGQTRPARCPGSLPRRGPPGDAARPDPGGTSADCRTGGALHGARGLPPARHVRRARRAVCSLGEDLAQRDHVQRRGPHRWSPGHGDASASGQGVPSRQASPTQRTAGGPLDAPRSNFACTSIPRPDRPRCRRFRPCPRAPPGRNRRPHAVDCRLSWTMCLAVLGMMPG